MTALEVEGLSVAYGGNVAVERVSLRADRGAIAGLIGPNGAGKTTTFNACNGLVRPAAGSIRLFGHDVTRRGPASRAQLGLGRTFQVVEVCDSMTVAANVAIGLEARLVGGNPLRQFRPRRADRTRVAAATERALDTCGISDLAAERASVLTTGQRRLLELARVIAGGYRLLLLDEPSSGLDVGETAAFGKILSSITAGDGPGILLVEHDMALVMGICDFIYVLDFGRMIFQGTAEETRASSVVRAAYLGNDAQ
jgi:ABC-type branched-subunit amino acid transport system ATPase component